MPPVDDIVRVERMRLERELLQTYFHPVIARQNTAGEDTFDLRLRTNRDTTYTVRLTAGPAYPDVIPRAYIVTPHGLRNARGKLLTALGTNVEMHLLTPEGASPQICHNHPGLWNASQTLYKVALKVRVWLEMYESHLETGLPIDTWLSHVECP
jgi:hypothetical protein